MDEKRKIERIVEEYKTTVKATKHPMDLKANYPDINIYYNLKSMAYLIESNYHHFREKIFELLVFGGVRSRHQL